MALRWNLARVNDPFRASGSTPLHSCLPPIWGTIGGGLQYPGDQATERHGRDHYLHVVQFYTEKQKHNNYIVGRNHEGACGCLSPLLRSLVMNELLNDNDYYTEGYANDTAILTNKKLSPTMLELL
jgi:hypothetical protein